MENISDRWYQNLTYTEAKDILQEKLTNIKMNFIAAGYYLKYIRDHELYLDEGYKTIWEFAEDNYGIRRTTASRWMLMNDRFSVNGNTPILADEYKAYGKSQLQEMLYLEVEQLEEVTPGMTVKELREIRKPDQTEEQLPEQAKEEEIMCDVAHAGKCIHRPEFFCTLPEKAKTVTGDGVDCSKKCCWDCLKGNDCKYRCNSASGHPLNDQIPGQMSVEDYPELIPENDSEQEDSACEHEANVIDGEYREVKEELYEKISSKPEEDIDYAAEQAEIPEECCENSSDIDLLRDMLEKEKRELEEWIKVDKVEPFPQRLLQKKKITVAALAGMLCDLDNCEEEPEQFEQPELPVMKNNDQRKEWLRNYADWGLWYRDEHINVNYYKYDFFDNGAVLIAEEYEVKGRGYVPDYKTAYFHLVGGPEPPKHEKYGYGRWTRNETYERHPNSDTELVEFLKYVQREGRK